MESMAADEDFEPNQDSSFSEDELVTPRSNSVSERVSTPGQYTDKKTRNNRYPQLQLTNNSQFYCNG